MTILSAIQGACTVIGLAKPVVALSSTKRELVELVDVAQEMADRIAKAYEWQALTTLATYTGDGATEEFDLPADYDRMPQKAQLWSSTIRTPLTHIVSIDEWLGLEVQAFNFVVNVWIIFGGQIHIKPAMATGITAKHYYQSSKPVLDQDGTTAKAAFENDTDTFRLDERLLKLGIVWQWRANKGLPYGEDMANYEDLLSKLIAADKGSRILRSGKVRFPRDVSVAYPENITP